VPRCTRRHYTRELRRRRIRSARQQAWGGQSLPECVALKKYSIPVSIAGNKCWDGKKAVAYAE